VHGRLDDIENAPERISHDKNETLHCCTYRSRTGRSAIRCKRTNVGDESAKQRERTLRRAGTARDDWKLRADCRDGDSAFHRNVQPAIGRRNELSAHLEQHESSTEVETAVG